MEKHEGVYHLEGSVRIEGEGAVLNSERALYDEPTGDAYAEGGVRYEDEDVIVNAESAEINLETRTGTIHNAEILVKADGFIIRGDEIKKVGKDRYLIEQASATTCQGGRPAWCFRGREVDVLIGERLKARHATFRVKGVPLIYTPYLWAPIVTERRTGLLPPTVGFRDSTGFLYRQPFFWAAAPNRDATLYMDYYSKRAFGEGIEYRYIERGGVKGNLDLYHLRDGRRKRDYYEARGLHVQEGGPVSGFAEVNLVNYREFYRRYEPYLELSARRYLESRGQVSARSGNSRSYVLAQYFQDLKEGVDKDTVLQRLPEAGFYLAPADLGPVVVSGLATATNFARDEGPEGQRYTLGLRGTHSVGQGITLSQSVGARQMYYDLDTQGAGADDFGVEVFDYTANLQTTLSRAFGDVWHTVTPALSYTYITLDGKAPPLLDSLELVRESSVAEMSLLNRFSDQRGEFLTLRAIQPYDLDGGQRPFLPLRVDASIRRPFDLGTAIVYDVHQSKVLSSNSSITFRLPRTTVTAGQRYLRSTDLMLYTLETGIKATESTLLEGSAWYDSEGGGLRELRASVKYQSQCYGVKFSFVKRPDDYGVFFNFSLLNVGEFKV